MARNTRILTLQLTPRRALILLAAGLVAALYLADLTGMGMVNADEPRYAWIGRAMAQSGDWITPRLWSRPWFEKPPLLYWMTAAGFRARLGPDLAPRLPVALLSVAFIAFLWFRVRGLWDERVAWCSAAVLSSTAGWLAYSHVAVTDLPLAVLFSAAVLLSIGEVRYVTLAAACLGFAVLAKSLVPLVLFVPVPALDYRRWREWLRPAPVLTFLVIAVPWHVLCAARNGWEFARVLFVQQQFGRFVSPERQHVQKWWFYVPVLLLLLFPWFPLFAVVPRDSIRDPRVRTLAAVALFGFVFFSASTNKLPGYLLPLLPCICILMALGLARSTRTALPVAAAVAMLGLLPAAVGVAPLALAHGLRNSAGGSFGIGAITLVVPGALALVLATVMLLTPIRNRLFPAAFVLAAVAWLWFEGAAFPLFDSTASARPLWLSARPTCAPVVERGIIYGLDYYAARELPPCSAR